MPCTSGAGPAARPGRSRAVRQRRRASRRPGLPWLHGTTWQDLATPTWRDWYAEAERALAELRDACEQVFVTGLSMGACPALPDAEVRPLENSFHVATLDNDAPTIFDGTLKFIKEHGYKD